MRARRTAALAAAVLALAACKPEVVPAGPDAGGTGPVETWATSLVPWGLRGAVAVVEDGTTTVSAGFGALTPGGTAPIGTGTRMAIGSLTKPVTALAIWRLTDQGRVGIDETLGELLPGVPGDKAPITVGQLLSHTSGIADAHGPDEEQIDRAEALRRIYAAPPLFEPGEDESYSNSGYTLLAAVIEEASGRAYEDYLAEEIFAPAGMTASGFHADPPPPGTTEATGSNATGTSGTPSGLPALSWTLRGAGGVVSTVDDLLALDRALFTGSLLSPKTREVALEHSLGEIAPEIEGIAAAGETPEIDQTSMWLSAPGEGRVVVVLSADRRVLAEDLAGRLGRHLLLGEGLPAPPPTAAPDPAADAAVAGEYRSETGAVITVAAHTDGIRLSTDDGRAFGDLFAVGDDTGEIASPEEVVATVEELRDEYYLDWLAAKEAELGPLDRIEIVGIAPVDSPEPATYLRHHFVRGTALTFWAVSAHGEVLSVELGAAPPGAVFRRSAVEGYVSYAVAGAFVAGQITFDGDVMRIRNGDRTTEYHR
ncbi:serine hydrolase domain-containing protein [Phytomonospora endophytica]|uniref:CubicO group peptidase (Beta-lactamase class C family) n=1 Tax=Phytomonospora endophytica TaxID=714109 RepID=A0A841FKT7_9ACTN|nr:serine hydrolase domain-containing protein [Phytomonospora endophytica]MBB6035533.1 CubicO group peptidase (beta-lactamase class C family) [Phytomonospora endophytica]GIG70104.1 hypothetical protein Pen01_63990 [Phytomonospora endophytica]